MLGFKPYILGINFRNDKSERPLQEIIVLTSPGHAKLVTFCLNAGSKCVKDESGDNDKDNDQ